MINDWPINIAIYIFELICCCICTGSLFVGSAIPRVWVGVGHYTFDLHVPRESLDTIPVKVGVRVEVTVEVWVRDGVTIGLTVKVGVTVRVGVTVSLRLRLGFRLSLRLQLL